MATPLSRASGDYPIEAWAEIPVKAQYANFELDGIADGVLGLSVAGRLEAPYLVVVEAKKGIEGQNPVFQLYGQLLAAAHINWRRSHQEPQVLFGCYTVGDSWQFVRAQISGLESERPELRVEFSREYVEKLEAQTILKILKQVVALSLPSLEQAIS